MIAKVLYVNHQLLLVSTVFIFLWLKRKPVLKINLTDVPVYPFFLLLWQLGFKMFLGFSPVVTNWSAASDEFSLILDNNPMAEFAELPEGRHSLLFSNILCGVLRGALEMVRNVCSYIRVGVMVRLVLSEDYFSLFTMPNVVQS